MVELDHVMCTRDPDGEEADAIRDRMERPWYAMSPDEEALVRGLSQDLYTIGTARPAPNRDDAAASDELAEALNRGNWVKALDLLRREEALLPQADVAALRGVCWSCLGEHSAALAFIDEAFRLAPSDSQFLALRWEALVRAQCTADASRDAEEKLSGESLADSYAHFKAADVLMLHATQSPDSESHRLYELARQAVNRGLERLPPEPLDAELQRVRINAYLNLAFSYDQLGDPSKAIEAYDRALTLDPTHADALMLRAMLLQSVNPQAARADVRRCFGVRLASQLAELPVANMMTAVGS